MQTLQILLVLSLAYTVITIKVPVAQIEDSPETNVEKLHENKNLKNSPIYYESDEEDVDSYLVPPNPQSYEDTESDDNISTPATHLLPPLPGVKSEYYVATEPAVQSDWYPIVQELPKTEQIAFINNPKSVQPQNGAPLVISNIKKPSKVLEEPIQLDRFIPIPSRRLVPPANDAKAHFYVPETPAVDLELPIVDSARPFSIPTPASELQLPLLEVQQNFNPVNENTPLRFKPVDPTLALHLTPPKPLAQNKYKNPTKLYPKKYAGGFKPIPIPISQFGEGNIKEAPKARPIKLIKQISSSDELYAAPIDEKKVFLYQQAEEKRKLKNQEDEYNRPKGDLREEQELPEEVQEQEVSETNFRQPPIRHTEPLEDEKSAEEVAPPAPKDRTEFRVHGMKGPNSYQFGYDTGKGKNRQFRYEERDNDGHVRGHYGYMDRNGKLQVVNYDAHPEHGFHAEGPK